MMWEVNKWTEARAGLSRSRLLGCDTLTQLDKAKRHSTFTAREL